MDGKLSKSELLRLLAMLMHPEGITEAEGDDMLRAFCAGCPDPEKARWLIVECLEPMSDMELVECAMAMPSISSSTSH